MKRSQPAAKPVYTKLTQKYYQVEPNNVGGVNIISEEPVELGGQNVTFGNIHHGRRRNYILPAVKVHTGPRKGLWIADTDFRLGEFRRS